MRRMVVCLMLLCAAALVAQAKPGASRSDRDEFQGPWDLPMHKPIGDERHRPFDSLNWQAFRFEGAKLFIEVAYEKSDPGGRRSDVNYVEVPCSYALRENASPRQIDIVGPRETRWPAAHGVYKIEGGDLTICLRFGNDPRPRDFTMPEDVYGLLLRRPQAKDTTTRPGSRPSAQRPQRITKEQIPKRTQSAANALTRVAGPCTLSTDRKPTSDIRINTDEHEKC